MTDNEILTMAVEKAMKNGFNAWGGVASAGLPCGQSGPESDEPCIYTTIFSHDFAKAFWGEEPQVYDTDQMPVLKHWEHRLQIMVLRSEPLKYLEQFL